MKLTAKEKGTLIAILDERIKRFQDAINTSSNDETTSILKQAIFDMRIIAVKLDD